MTTTPRTATTAHRPQRKGASSAVLMSATGWQAVHGARAGALKRRGLLLTPEKRGCGYRSRGPGERADRAGSRGPRRP